MRLKLNDWKDFQAQFRSKKSKSRIERSTVTGVTSRLGGGFGGGWGLWSFQRLECRRIFSTTSFSSMNATIFISPPHFHPIYSSVYKLPGLPKIHEHDGLPAQGFGLFFEKRLILFYAFSSDIGDGMEDAEVYHDPPQSHEAALEMGVNIVAWFFDPIEEKVSGATAKSSTHAYANKINFFSTDTTK